MKKYEALKYAGHIIWATWIDEMIEWKGTTSKQILKEDDTRDTKETPVWR